MQLHNVSRYAVQSEFNVVYGIQPSWRGSMDTLKLDIFKPIGDQNTNRPVLFLVHGGGFSGGNKADVKALCETYASRGVVAIASVIVLDLCALYNLTILIS